MREIKFRVFDSGKKKMNTNSVCYQLAFGADGIIKAGIREDVLMQYTGFKDFDGKEIYEGDVLEYVHYANALIKRRVAVEFDIECGGWYVTKHFEYLSDLLHKQHNEVFKKSQGHESSSNHNVRIIGNIYENPELLNQ